MEPGLHANESERLQALHRYDVLDTPRERDFDEVVELIASICETPVATISLVDADRQWFKAEIGLGIRETPRTISACAHAILQTGMLIVPDLRQDARFRDNPLVAGEPHFRFYAGARLEAEDGLPLGTLCVLDYRPRELDERQTRTLQLMAKQVMRQLDLRRLLQTERLAREQAEMLAEQNALLVREVDHRVKNSLQLVSSLLALQKREASNDETKVALADAENRVRAVASVHDQLQQAGLSDRIPISAFLESLCRSVSETRPAHVDEIACAIEPTSLDSDQAVAVGLIVNELVANAFKHAFPDGRAGRVQVGGSRSSDGYCLEVTDDGIGLPTAFEAARGSGLGWRVLRALSERLMGTLEFMPAETGAKARICFPLTA